MIRAQKDFTTIYFANGVEAAKFLKCSYRRVLDTLWYNSGMNKQVHSYTGFPLKRPGEYTRKGWILEEVDISQEEADLRNALAGFTLPLSSNP